MRRTWASLAVVLLVALLVYAPLLVADFTWDDETLLPALAGRGLGGLAWLTRGLWPEELTAVNGLPVYRPLMELDLQLVLAAVGLRPFAFHLVSLALFLGVGALVWALALRLLDLCACAPPRRAPLAALATGLVLLHPAHQEAVGFIAARNDLWAAAAVLGSALLWLGPRWFLAPLVVLAGLLFKELTLIALLLLPALDLLRRAHGHSPLRWRRWLLLALAPAAWAGLRFGLADLPASGLRWPPLWSWAAGLCHAGAMLLGARAPSAHQPLSLVLSLPSWWLPGAAALLALALLLGRTWIGRLGLATWLLCVGAALTFAVPTDNYSDRYLFLADIGLALGAVCPLARLRWTRWQQGLALGLLGVLAALNAGSLHRWASTEALWESAARHDPTGYASHQLGLVLLGQDREEEATVALEAALAAPRPDPTAAVPLGMSLIWRGELARGCSLLAQTPAPDLEQRARQAATLCLCARLQGRPSDARAALARGLELDPGSPLVQLERYALAVQIGDQALLEQARAGLASLGLSEERGRQWIEHVGKTLGAAPALPAASPP